MNIVIFGATGMVGQGALRECLLDPDVERVLTVGRRATGQTHEKLRELEHADLFDYSSVEDALRGFDVCLFCLGVSSAGMSEGDYRHITYDLTLAAANALLKVNPGIVFIFVSGAGTDSSGRSRTMWARVKGEAENALLALPFKAAYMFRPGFIEPLHGIRSRTRAYNVIYSLIRPAVPLLHRFAPRQATTTERLGRAMLEVAKRGASKLVLETADINEIALPPTG